MSNIATLATLAASYFKGGINIQRAVGRGSKLVDVLNTVISKVNEIISEQHSLPVLSVGDTTDYYSAGDSWLLVDGVHPPMVSKLWMQDQVTGLFRVISISSGVLSNSSV